MSGIVTEEQIQERMKEKRKKLEADEAAVAAAATVRRVLVFALLMVSRDPKNYCVRLLNNISVEAVVLSNNLIYR